jgi:hypothetical protein
LEESAIFLQFGLVLHPTYVMTSAAKVIKYTIFNFPSLKVSTIVD